MKLADFDYSLPEELIAQEPSPARDQSRLMIIDRQSGSIRHSIFNTLPEYLQPGDVLVVNNSRVIPARLTGKKTTGGRVEILLLSRQNQGTSRQQCWEALLRPAKSIRPGMVLRFAEGCEACIVSRISEKKWLLDFTLSLPFAEFLEQQGASPLPPYIKRRGVETGRQALTDRERYQTIYAQIPGSVAAPTAGLHFSPEVLTALEGKGIPVARVTLHVGYGTFSPVAEEDVEDHRMDEEQYEISAVAAAIINHAERVVAVGTTSARTLEAATDEQGIVQAGRTATDIFIYPGYRFQRVNALLTNFHLPKSTLYLLVCTFAGRELIREAYRQAIAERYRFYSYGDCMLIL
ncbi:MAG: tRNA preQ1(34) S-adenosylmethionine ribosyltransferase-isomerase QueA [Deltaproteobacteria bacterium]|nr:tRNA preQ1(34) S-adenosylmethionine ribosyltransferase-isomerase QueA [Deltaproteobacteria bacterium]